LFWAKGPRFETAGYKSNSLAKVRAGPSLKLRGETKAELDKRKRNSGKSKRKKRSWKIGKKEYWKR
jgi:hypothetical protein